MKAPLRSLSVVVCLLLTGLLQAAPANAHSIAVTNPATPWFSATSWSLFDRPMMVDGQRMDLAALLSPATGTWSFELSDLGFPTALQSLSLFVTNLADTWRLDGPGVLNVDITSTRPLYVAVFAQSADRYGMYSIHAGLVEVPLPASAWLLLSALGGWLLMRGRRTPASGWVAAAT